MAPTARPVAGFVPAEHSILALPCGTSVVLHSLQDAEYNQLPGCVREYDPARARYKVAIERHPSRAPSTDDERTYPSPAAAQPMAQPGCATPLGGHAELCQTPLPHSAGQTHPPLDDAFELKRPSPPGAICGPS